MKPVDNTIKDYISYNPKTGVLTWKKNSGFKQKVGHEITCKNFDGYITVGFKCKRYRGHRVAWFITYGEWPKEIDHINGIRDDNRLINLRKITRKFNNINSKLRKDNLSGKAGVSKCAYGNKWVVRISTKNKYLMIGRFDNLQNAIDARIAAELKYYKVNSRS